MLLQVNVLYQHEKSFFLDVQHPMALNRFEYASVGRDGGKGGEG